MSRYLLDTNVISEVVRPVPHEALLQWLSPLPESSLYLSAITIGELVKGIVALEEGQKKTRLKRWMNTDIPALFAGRILSYDEQAARLWGVWSGEGKRIGRSVPLLDAQIAATAARYDCVLVTRNHKDIERLPVQICNPWEG
ncbi:MAG: type II toxin-antitoxin system VapC family toxin [Rhizonema sp. PD38]|nr:type II toxin-antitoxin system VapC family toxin [Rhizonema sp. PD38]